MQLKVLLIALIVVISAGTLIAQPPAVTTDSITSIGITSATGGGEVTNDWGYEVTARGVCWSMTANPTIGDSFTTDGTGMGLFSSSLTSLTAGTTYYVRAYATNLMYGTGYGNEVSFTTGQLEFTQPALSAQWTTGQTYNVIINNLGDTIYSANAGIYLSTDGGNIWNLIGSAGILNAGPDTISWAVDLATPASANCKLAISDYFVFDLNWQYYAESETFEILTSPPTLTINQPATGSFWQSGIMHDIVWMSANVGQDEIIQYSIDGGTSWSDIDTIYGPNNGLNYYTWTVPAVIGIEGNSMVRVVSWDLVVTGSSSVFSISETPLLLFVQPAIATAWTTAHTWQIEINNQGAALFNPAARIFLSTNGGDFWDILFSVPELNAGLNTFSWTIDLATVPSAFCKLAYSLVVDSSISSEWEFHTESEIFEILPSPAEITVSQPTTGEFWLSGEMYNIEWMSLNVFQAEKIQYSIDGGSTWIESDTIWTPVNGANSYSWSVPYVAG
jgi:hypothetical protein